MTFSSDSRQMNEVVITVEDCPAKNKRVNWIARIEATDLRLFCDRFVELLNNRIG